jgi:formylglycine-generating enzyme required for sulfatase activity
MPTRTLNFAHAETYDETPLYSNSWAIVVGVNQYDDPSIPPLHCAIADATAIRDVLPALGFPEENVFTLLDQEVTPDLVRKRLRDKMGPDMRPDDRLLIYFACHGVATEWRQERHGHLLLHKSEICGAWPTAQHPYLSAMPKDTLEMRSFLTEIDAMPAKHKVIFADACFSGLMSWERSVANVHSDPELRACVAEPVTQVFTAGRSGEAAQEDDRHGHGEFTRQLLKGMAGAADNSGRGWFALSQLANFVTERVRTISRGRQNPMWIRHGEGDFAFVWSRESRSGLSAWQQRRTTELERLLDQAGEEERRGNLMAAYRCVQEAQTLGLRREQILSEIARLENRIERDQLEAGRAAAQEQVSQALSKIKARAADGVRQRTERLTALLHDADDAEQSQQYNRAIEALELARELAPELAREIDSQIEVSRAGQRRLDLANSEREAQRLAAEGESLFFSCNFEEAVKILTRSLELSPNRPSARDLLELAQSAFWTWPSVQEGERLLAAGRIAEARVLWEEALVKVPEFPGLRQRVESARARESALPLTRSRNAKDGLMYVLIRPGVFRMGAVPGDRDAGPEEKPGRHVKISKGFWITESPVTIGAYRKYRPNSLQSRRPAKPSVPVTNITWEEALRFCRNSGGRLPTEAEWEYAVRGGVENLRFPWGDSPRAIPEEIGEVGHSGPNGFGLMDVGTNLLEWCNDVFDEGYYKSRPNPDTDPAGPEMGVRRVVRGGSYSSPASPRRLSARTGKVSSIFEGLANVGFRCVINDVDHRRTEDGSTIH